jgi:hypothetical protein
VLFVKEPSSHPADDTACTSSQTLPLLDFGATFVLAELAVGVSSDRGESPGLSRDLAVAAMAAGAVGTVISGVVGMRRTAACRRWNETLELKRAMRPFETPRARVARSDAGVDPWLSAGPPPEGFPPPPPAPDGGTGGPEVGP